MARVPCGKYTNEFREEAVKLVTEGDLSVAETARRLSLPKSRPLINSVFQSSG